MLGLFKKNPKKTITINVNGEYYIKFGHAIVWVRVYKIDAISVSFDAHERNGNGWFELSALDHREFADSMWTKADYEPRQSVTLEV